MVYKEHTNVTLPYCFICMEFHYQTIFLYGMITKNINENCSNEPEKLHAYLVNSAVGVHKYCKILVKKNGHSINKSGMSGNTECVEC